MNTCDTCKWWGDRNYRVHEGYQARDCMNEKLGKAKSSDMDGLYSPHESSIEGWGFGVVTNSKFGCIHHEPK